MASNSDNTKNTKAAEPERILASAFAATRPFSDFDRKVVSKMYPNKLQTEVEWEKELEQKFNFK